MYSGRTEPNDAPMGVDTMNNFISKISANVDQSVKKQRSKRPKRCPYDYTRILNISKTMGWIGADRLYMGYTWTGIIKLILGLICMLFAPITLGNSIILLGVIWMGDLIMIYSGRLPPINCYDNIKLTRPGWRYFSKTPGSDVKLTTGASVAASQSTFYAILFIIILLGMMYFTTRE
jgi:TM2 domain-containing membrane protein YozV